MVFIPSLEGPNRRLKAQVRHILDQTWNVLLANLGCGIIYLLASWSSINHARLIGWGTLLLAMLIVRTVYVIIIRRRGDNYIDTHAESIMRGLAFGLIVSAAIWGLIGSPLLYSSDPFAIMVSTFIIAGLSGGGVASYAVSPRLLYSFLILIVGPLIVRLGLEPDGQYKFLAALAGLYLLLLSISARNVSRYNLESIDMSLVNQDLIRRLNNASHEIRTPVAAIAGFAEVLKERGDLPPVDRDFVKIIFRNSVYLGRLVDNLFLISKAEAGELANKEETFNLIDLVQLAVELVRRKAEDKGLRLVVDVSPETPPFVTTCPIKLQQVLINLLNNAVKFTDRGEVRLTLERLKDDRLRVVVSDTGLGISEECQPLIFEPFWRENRHEVQREEGSGLGLTLSRQLVVMMGGDLRLVSSKVGEGSVFEFALPVTWSTSHVPHGLAGSRRARLLGKVILLADDSMDLRSLYAYRFAQAGAIVETAEDGRDALAKIQREGQKFAAVVLDIHMPELDGYRTATQMRKSGVKTPILALTATGECPQEREKCLAAGFNAIINKSNSVNKIVDLVAEFV